MEGLLSVPPERGTIIGRAIWKVGDTAGGCTFGVAANVKCIDGRVIDWLIGSICGYWQRGPNTAGTDQPDAVESFLDSQGTQQRV